MEDLWKFHEMSCRLSDVAGQAEYDLMRKRFREAEERDNRNNLLYGQAPFRRPSHNVEE